MYFQPANTDIVLPLGAAHILGYSQGHMRNLHEHGIIGHLAHRLGCESYYRLHELLAFKRQVRMDLELAAWIELLKPSDEDC